MWLASFIYQSQNGLLLAQEAAYKHLGDNFNEEAAGINWWQLALAIGVIISALVLAYFINRYFQFFERRSKRSTARLFWDLCHAHELDHQSRHLLKMLAHAHHLNPADLFMMPEKFEPTPELVAIPAQKRAAVTALRDRLFGSQLFVASTPEEVAEST